jgi:transposase InsO family protein
MQPTFVLEKCYVYLAFILDACSRKVVGWSTGSHLRTKLLVDALRIATALRKFVPHSDRGVSVGHVAILWKEA